MGIPVVFVSASTYFSVAGPGQAGRDRLLDTGAAAPQSAGIHREYQSGTADNGTSTSLASNTAQAAASASAPASGTTLTGHRLQVPARLKARKTSFCFAASSSSSRPIGHLAPDDASEGNVAPFGVSRPRPYPVTARSTRRLRLRLRLHLSRPWTSPQFTWPHLTTSHTLLLTCPQTWFRFYNRRAGTFLLELYCTRSSITYRATIDKRPSRYPSAIPRSPPHVGKSQHL
ncbi:hypothetical protein CMUS01_09726 [Colletotrichum musicola]|uniref:Uncharacterized protein n=1 Tax=Colletotrichum musicola TaxID=2175873 RepID=A0A8H6K6L1_9PEZI|nr:hypothetical protein CMUS01_09726 [Colletotrichum musicola]